MSFSKTLKEACDQVICNYVAKISSVYKIDQKDLVALWDGVNNTQADEPVRVEAKAKAEAAPANSTELKKMSLVELKELCRNAGHKVSGTKASLIARLSGEKVQASPASKPKQKTSRTKEEKEKTKLTKKPVMANLLAAKPLIAVQKNIHQNYEHPETSLVFNNKTKKVIGKQMDDGTVEPLTKDDINICNKYKFPYEIPENLEKKGTLDNVTIKELVDDGDENIEEGDLLSEEFEEEFEYEEEEGS